MSTHRRVGARGTVEHELMTKVRAAALHAAAQLAGAVDDDTATPDHFLALEDLIAALPLAAAEHSVVLSRLLNGARYYDGGESQAAAFELRTLLKSLEQAFRMDGAT